MFDSDNIPENAEQYLYLNNLDKIKVAEKAARVCWSRYGRSTRFDEVEAYAYVYAFAWNDRQYEKYLDIYGNEDAEAEKQVLFHVVCSCLRTHILDEIKDQENMRYLAVGESGDDKSPKGCCLDTMEIRGRNQRVVELEEMREVAKQTLNSMVEDVRVALSELMEKVLDWQSRSHITAGGKVSFNRPELQEIAKKHNMGYKRLEAAWDAYCNKCREALED